MPYTAKQRARFHAGAERGEPGMAKLAKEADAYAKAGKEKPSVAKKTTLPAKSTKKVTPPPAGKKASPSKTSASKKGMGFKAAQAKIAKRMGVSDDRAGAILASASRKASAAAKKKNPNLKKVKG